MENSHSTLNSTNISIIDTLLDRSQSQTLAAGYQLVLIKIKAKKKFKIITRIFFFNF